MTELPNGTVMFTAFSTGRQEALDDAGNIWNVDGWFVIEGGRENNELEMTPDNWVLVDFVTVWHDFPEGRKWATLFPADFDGAIIRTDN